ncbi:MAG: HisA/HisF-related TIM barrel protein [Candidatus Thorarchaeota archaeon]
MRREADIIPVMDIMEGQVVHGVAGQRDAYKPIESRIVKGSDPLDVANAIKKTFEVETLYIADLDAITGDGDNFDIIAEIIKSSDLEVLLDGGLASLDDLEPLFKTGVHHVVVATETIESMEELARIFEHHGESLVGSLDLMNGQTMSACSEFADKSPKEMAGILEDLGVEKLIVLELSLVGSGKGPVHDALLEICENSSMEIIAGGGVRNRDDLRRLFDLGVRSALVATALHCGSILP